MKEIKSKTCINNKTCQTGNCGRSLKEMALGLAVVFIILFAAVIFGN